MSQSPPTPDSGFQVGDRVRPVGEHIAKTHIGTVRRIEVILHVEWDNFMPGVTIEWHADKMERVDG